MNEMVPKIRFSSFTDDWEQRKLDTIFKKIRNAFVGTATPYYVDRGHFYLESNNVKNGQINRDTEIFINDEFYNKQSDKLLHTGDIVMVQSGHVGHSAVIPPELDGIAAHALIMLTNYKEETNPFFLNYQFQTYKSKKRLDTITTGNTIKHILSSEMKEFIVDYPSFEEQQKIGTFFQQLDNLITLHQRKLELLKEQKKGFLQKMFPKDGQLVPEVRFEGFTDDWEQRKLGNHANILTGGTPKTTVPSYWEPKEIPWMSSGEVNKRRLIDTDNMISKEGLENSSARWVKKHSILIALAGQGKTRGTVAINDVALVTNQSIAAIEPDESLYYEFVFQNLSKRYDELRMISSGDGTRGGLNKKIISDIEISSPTIKEQREIGQFFKQLDNLITLHQRKLELLKEQKKGFLQKMFVS